MTEAEANRLVDASSATSVALHVCGGTVDECRDFSAAIIRALPERIARHPEIRKVIFGRFRELLAEATAEIDSELIGEKGQKH